MIGGPTRCKGGNAVEAKLAEIQAIDKNIDRPHWIVLANIVIKHRRKQRALPAIRPLNKACHPIPSQIARTS